MTALPDGDAGAPDLEPEPPDASTVFGDRVDLARAYVDLLAGDGVVRGVIGPREAGRLWTRHVLNCAALTELLPAGARIVDVGSGGGLPGVVLAIARPDCQVALLEPLERRVRFLTEVVDQLLLINCRVVRGRAQEAPPEIRGADVAVSRAVAPLGKLAGWCAGLLRPGGTFLALKGATAADELRRDKEELVRAGLRGGAVVRLDGPVEATFVVRATRAGRARSGAAGPAARRRAGRRPPAGGRSSD